jgi:hypothetical protein
VTRSRRTFGGSGDRYIPGGSGRQQGGGEAAAARRDRCSAVGPRRAVAFIAAGDEFPAVREALRDVERRRAHLRTQLAAALDGLGRAVTLDGARLERELNDSLDDRHSSLLAGHVPRARQILRKLLSDRIPFSPRSDGASRRYEFTRHGELGRIFAGLRAAHGGVSPTGLARIDARIFGRPPSRSSAN